MEGDSQKVSGDSRPSSIGEDPGYVKDAYVGVVRVVQNRGEEGLRMLAAVGRLGKEPGGNGPELGCLHSAHRWRAREGKAQTGRQIMCLFNLVLQPRCPPSANPTF